MEKKSKNCDFVLNKNIFKKINFSKDNRIKYEYRNYMKNLNKFSNTFNFFIDSIQNFIENNGSLTGRLPNNKKLYTLIDYKNNTINSKFSTNNIEKFENNRVFKFQRNHHNKNNSMILSQNNKNMKLRKNILKKKESTSQTKILKQMKNNIKKYNEKKLNSLLKINPNSNLNNSLLYNNSKSNFNSTNFYKTRNYSLPQNPYNNSISAKNNSSKKKIISNISSKFDNYNSRSKKYKKATRPQSATITSSINKYNYKYEKEKEKSKSSKFNKSSHLSKNLSLSLYRNNFKYFDNYHQLMPKYLNKFVTKSKKIQNSYEKDLTINMPKKTKEILNIAKDEKNMKNPGYHQKQIFKNVLQIKKTLRQVRRMRNEEKLKVKYFGPGNINNESLMRKNNANLVNFCDSVKEMKDDKFYQYRQFFSKHYPELEKGVFKEKYKISEKDEVNERKCNENLIKIQRLFALIEK